MITEKSIQKRADEILKEIYGREMVVSVEPPTIRSRQTRALIGALAEILQDLESRIGRTENDVMPYRRIGRR